MAVEPPLRVEHREEFVSLLVQACELEHGLMCEYLFARFTLKRSADEGLSVEPLAKVATWEAVLVENLDDAEGIAAVGQAQPLAV